MKFQAIFFKTTQQLKTPLLFILIFLLTSNSNNILAQATNLIGIEYGGILIPKISSSGVNNSNYSFAIHSETELNSHWSIGYGLKYLKYGSHIYYKPIWGLVSGVRETLVEKQQYGIQNIGICIVGKYRIKSAGLFLGIQPEKASFNSIRVSHEVIPIVDIRRENYAQKELRSYNVSLIGGLEFKRKFGERFEFYTKPSAQYFLKSFYVHDGFKDTKIAFHLTFGCNFILNVFADSK